MRVEGNIQQTEQSINQVVTLKTFIDSIKPIWQALAGAGSEELRKIRQVRLDVTLNARDLTSDSFVTPKTTK